MFMKKTAKIFLISGIAVILFSAIIPAFAYFLKSSDKSAESFPTFEMRDDNTIVIEINTQDDLIKYSSAATVIPITDKSGDQYNPDSPTSSTDIRRILQLKSDIVLSMDIVITADCHIELGTNTLTLNGHNLTFRHTYHGNILLSCEQTDSASGAIIVNPVSDDNSSNKNDEHIYFETPYAYPHLSPENEIFTDVDGNKYPDSSYITVNCGEDDLSVAYHALYFVGNVLSNDTDPRPGHLDYGELKQQSISGVDIPASLLLAQRSDCIDSGNAECCVYVTGDIDLPVHLLGYSDIRIIYESSNPSVVSELGNVNLTSDKTDVTLTAKVMREENIIGQTDFILHVINPESSNQLYNAAYNMLLTYLYNRKTTDNKFEFYTYAELPSNVSIGNKTIKYSYTAFMEDGIEYTGRFDVGEKITIFTPSVLITRIGVKMGIGTGESSVYYIDTDCRTAGTIKTNITVANAYLFSLGYGSSININANQNANTGEYEYSSAILPVMTENNGGILNSETDSQYQIVSVEYSITTGQGLGIYTISDIRDATDSIKFKYYSLEWAGTVHPYENVQPIIVKCDFTFKNGSVATLYRNVTCTYSGQGENLSGYLPYYQLYESNLLQQTGLSTTESFRIPVVINNTITAVAFDVYNGETKIENQNFVELKLLYNGTYYNYTDFFKTDAGYVISKNNNVDLSNSEWEFTIIKDNIPRENHEIKIRFYYNQGYNSISDSFSLNLYTDSDTESTSTEPVTCSVTIAGVLHASDVPDADFYEWIYRTFGTKSEYTSGDLIQTNWLSLNIDINVSTDILKNVTNFTGIKYLTGTQNVNLSGKNTATIPIDEIAQLPSLLTLNLSDCNLDNGKIDALGGTDNKLQNLKTLNIENNSIESFDFLLSLPALDAVYLSGQSMSDTNAIFYGSQGITNFETFQSLSDRGVSVYNVKSGDTNILFEENHEINDYVNLKSIEYQSKLKTGLDISTVYNGFSTVPADYGLNTVYNGTNVSNQNIVYSHDGDGTTATSFKCTYTFSIDTTTISIVVIHKVTRT